METLRKNRDGIAFGLLAVPVLIFIVGVSLLFKSTPGDSFGQGPSFSDKAAAYGGVFLNPLNAIAIVLAVGLVTGLGGYSKNARTIVLGALLIGGLSALLGLVSLVAALGAESGVGSGAVGGSGKITGLLFTLALFIFLMTGVYYVFATFQALPSARPAQQAWGQQGWTGQPNQGWPPQVPPQPAPQQTAWGQPAQQEWGQPPQPTWDARAQAWVQPGQTGIPEQAPAQSWGQPVEPPGHAAQSWGQPVQPAAPESGPPGSSQPDQSWGQSTSASEPGESWGQPAQSAHSAQSWGQHADPAPAHSDEPVPGVPGPGVPGPDESTPAETTSVDQPAAQPSGDDEDPPTSGWWQQPRP